jgi:hypothetical protein
MTDDLAEQLAGLQRAMAAPLPDPEVLAAGTAEDRAMADRIHKVRPGVPLHHVFAVLEALRVVQRVDAAKEPSKPFEARIVLIMSDCDPIATCHCGARCFGDSINDALLAWGEHLTTVHRDEEW